MRDAILSFVLVAGLLTITPGLDTALVLRAAITRGTKHAYATAVGVGSGALAWGAGAAVGVSALLTASTTAYAVVRTVGAAYMIWLGTRMLHAAVRVHASGDPTATAVALAPEESMLLSWRRGLLTNLLNPKIGAFYVAVLPQFIPEHASHLGMGLLLAFVHSCEGMLWFTGIILGANQARGLLARRSTQRTIDGLTGSAFVGFGLKLGLSGR